MITLNEEPRSRAARSALAIRFNTYIVLERFRNLCECGVPFETYQVGEKVQKYRKCHSERSEESRIFKPLRPYALLKVTPIMTFQQFTNKMDSCPRENDGFWGLSGYICYITENNSVDVLY